MEAIAPTKPGVLAMLVKLVVVDEGEVVLANPMREKTEENRTTAPMASPAIVRITAISMLLKIVLSATTSAMYLIAISVRIKPTIPRIQPTVGTMVRSTRIDPIPPRVLA